MKRFRHLFFTALVVSMLIISAALSASAASDIVLKSASEASSVKIEGTAIAGQWVSIKVTKNDTELAYFNGQVAGTDGKYSFEADLSDFSSKLPLDLTVSYGSRTETAQIKLESNPSGGGGGGAGGGGAVAETQKPDISVSGNGGKTSLSSDGTKLTITPDNGYEVNDVTVNGISKGSITEISGLKTGDKVVVSFKVKQAQPGNDGKKFSDVASGSWYEKAVYDVVDKGLFTGVSDTKFAPNSPMNRAMFVTVLGRLNGGTLSGSHAFTDVKSGSWYDASVGWASSNNIVKGFSATVFGPERTITREQMAVIMYNYASFKGMDVKTGVSQSSFTDASKVSSWAKEAVDWASSAGLIQGDSNKAFNPQQTATRAQVAVILQRFAEKVK